MLQKLDNDSKMLLVGAYFFPPPGVLVRVYVYENYYLSFTQWYLNLTLTIKILKRDTYSNIKKINIHFNRVILLRNPRGERVDAVVFLVNKCWRV